MVRTVVVVALLSLLGQSPAQTEPQKAGTDGPFTVGVLRRDGLVLPFAAFDGKRWETPWPANIFNLALPKNTTEIPPQWWGKAGPQAQMTATLEGGVKKKVGIGAPVLVALSCSPQVMLLSDYRLKESFPSRSIFPYPKDGIVLGPDRPVDRIELVPPTAKEWSELGLSMLPAFDEAEQRAIKDFTNWKHPIDRMNRLRVPLRIEALYRAPMDKAGYTAYYIEAVKQYPPGPDDEGCGLVTSAWGWVLDGPPGKRKFEIAGRITYCDRKNVPYIYPFGIVHAAGRAYWIYQVSGTQMEGYLVARPTPERTETSVIYLAASCERPFFQRGRGGGG